MSDTPKLRVIPRASSTKDSPLLGLGPGDRISLSVSHALRINGDECWVKYEAGSTIRESEDGQQAHERVLKALTAGIDKAIDVTVEYANSKS